MIGFAQGVKRDRTRFVLESIQPIGVRAEGLRKDLNRDVTPEASVARAVDLAHAACAEHRQNLVRPRRVPADRGMSRR
jgi:hypothetical protein